MPTAKKNKAEELLTKVQAELRAPKSHRIVSEDGN